METEAAVHERYAPMGPVHIEEANELDRHFLPYVILQLPDGSYIFLNRYHKPVGMVSHDGDWVDYDTCAHRFQVCGLTPEVAKTISIRGSPNTARIVLYDDGCRPQDSETNRRALMARLKIFYALTTVKNLPRL